MKKITKPEFIKMVRKELLHLKKHTTSKEKSRLKIHTFNHEMNAQCIYGQLTTMCNNNRAKELMPKQYGRIGLKKLQWRRDDVLIGMCPFYKQSFVKGSTFTALEKYLFMVDSNQHEQVIKYIKGDIKTIIL